MKKLMSFVALLVCVVTLSGCGANTLTCTNEEGTQSLKATFTNDKISKINMSLKEDVGEANIDEVYSEMKEEIGTVDVPGIKVTVSKGKSDVTLNYEIDLTKASEESLEQIDFDKDEMDVTKEQLKKELEESGYTCK